MKDELSSLLSSSLSLNKSFTPQSSVIINLPAADRRRAAEVTGALLATNNAKNHCFFNERNFHNHIVHHLLALYSLGADPEFIKSSYDREALIQQPIDVPGTETVTAQNWTSFLGQRDYYGNYLKFFSAEIKKKTAIQVVHEYIFGNLEGQMLCRSFAGLLHPLIHWGYGLEFGLDEIVAEGLAITAVHGLSLEWLKITDLLKPFAANDGLKQPSSGRGQKNIASAFDFSCEETTKIFKPKSGLTAFEILHKISQDPELAEMRFQTGTQPPVLFEVFSEAHRQAMRKWCDRWEISSDCDWQEILEKTKELMWTVTVIYATSYDSSKGRFKLDFGLMHLVTASLFLPVVLPLINHELRPILLRAFFLTLISVWVGGGTPPLEIRKCLQEQSNLQIPPSQHPKNSENPWFKVLGSAAAHPDEHTTKIIRVFLLNAKNYGNSQAGYYSCALEGSELLDSTIFIRAAIMTLTKQDWERQKGEESVMKWFL